MDARPDTLEHFNNIVDSITCSDGGVRFVNFRVFIEEMDKRADKGDFSADQLIGIMKSFSRLINAANNMKYMS